MSASGRTLGRTSPLGLVACAALVLSGCAKSSGPAAGYSAPPAPSASPPTATGTTSSSIGATQIVGVGKVLVDQQGFTVYLNTQEKGSKLVCTGSCASVWPPVVLPSGVTSPKATAGAKSSLLGTMTLPDGSLEITYGGYPLHTFTGDSSTGLDNGESLSNVWFAVATSGTAAKPTSSGGGTGGGGY